MMSCCRNRNRDRDDVFGIQRIALRGPGCIDGTGRCRGVLGTGGRRRCEDLLDAAEDFCDEVFGDRGRRCCSNVLGTGEEDEIENKEDEIAEEMEIRGRDIVSGLPIKITITSDEIREALIESINSIVNAIRRVLERTPPELSSDIYTNGIYLSGGGALLKGLDIFIEKETGIKVYIAENPLQSVALGAGKICENL
jgi:hypothetical protein